MTVRASPRFPVKKKSALFAQANLNFTYSCNNMPSLFEEDSTAKTQAAFFAEELSR
jgi:hypothetical protein